MSAPHRSGSAETAIPRLFMEFYALIMVPGGHNLKLTYKDKSEFEVLQRNSKDKILSDIKAYVRYFKHKLLTPDAPPLEDLNFTC